MKSEASCKRRVTSSSPLVARSHTRWSRRKPVGSARSIALAMRGTQARRFPTTTIFSPAMSASAALSATGLNFAAAALAIASSTPLPSLAVSLGVLPHGTWTMARVTLGSR